MVFVGVLTVFVVVFVVFVLAFGFIVAAILIAVWGANNQERPAFTELWALPDDQTTTADGMVEFGVANHEQVSMDYRMVILFDGLVADTIQSIQLEPEQKWESVLMVPELEVSTIPQTITFRLYREDDETAYRQVRIIHYQENYTPVNTAPFDAP